MSFLPHLGSSEHYRIEAASLPTFHRSEAAFRLRSLQRISFILVYDSIRCTIDFQTILWSHVDLISMHWIQKFLYETKRKLESGFARMVFDEISVLGCFVLYLLVVQPYFNIRRENLIAPFCRISRMKIRNSLLCLSFLLIKEEKWKRRLVCTSKFITISKATIFNYFWSPRMGCRKEKSKW